MRKDLSKNSVAIDKNRNEYGVTSSLAGPVVLNPNKRKNASDVNSKVTKHARLDNLLAEMEHLSINMKLSLKPSDDGSSHRFTESPSYIENGEMRSYQIAGLNWMIALYEKGVSGILADETGLGKTLQTISLIGYLQLVQKVDGRFLVVVPLSTVTNWEREFEQWCPSLTVVSLHGADNVRRQTINTILNEKPINWDVCLTSYETCKLTYSRNFLNRTRWHHIILDEGMRIKNVETAVAQAVRLFKAEHRLILTGTPVNNNPHELWATLSFLMPTEFNSSFELDVSLDEESVVDQLQTILKPILLRRLKSQVEDIIPFKDINVCVDMTHCQREWYRKILNENIKIVRGNGEIRMASARSLFLQLRKCTNHPYLFEGAEKGPPSVDGDHIVNNSGKMIVLDMFLAKLKQRQSRVLIFSQFGRLLDIIEDYLNLHSEYEYCRLDGKVEIAERVNLISEFADPKSKKFVFLLSTRAGGLGINLTAADTVIIYDSNWNPQMDMQAISRAHRIGQTKEVRVFRLIAKNTVDEKMMERLSDVVIESHVKSRSVVPDQFYLDAVRFKTEEILSNDRSYNGLKRDKLIQEDSRKLVDQIFDKF